METIAKEQLTSAQIEFKKVADTFVNNYHIDKHNKGHVDALSKYFNKDKSIEEKGIYLGKGILIIGNVGSGKTLMMNIFRRHLYLKTKKTFLEKNIGTLASECRTNGEDAIYAYKKKDCFFDELGLSSENINAYGNKINIIEEIVRERHLDFLNYGTITHFTTNLYIDQIKEFYGERTASRLTEMCNFIELTSHDRRQDAIPKDRQALIKTETAIPQPEQQYEQACFSIISHIEQVREADKWIKFGISDIMSGIYYDFLADLGAINYSADQKTKIFQQACQRLLNAPDMADRLAHKTEWNIFSQAVQGNENIPRGNFFSQQMITQCKKDLFKEFVMDIIKTKKDIYKILNLQKPK